MKLDSKSIIVGVVSSVIAWWIIEYLAKPAISSAAASSSEES